MGAYEYYSGLPAPRQGKRHMLRKGNTFSAEVEHFFMSSMHSWRGCTLYSSAIWFLYRDFGAKQQRPRRKGGKGARTFVHLWARCCKDTCTSIWYWSHNMQASMFARRANREQSVIYGTWYSPSSGLYHYAISHEKISGTFHGCALIEGLIFRRWWWQH